VKRRCSSQLCFRLATGSKIALSRVSSKSRRRGFGIGGSLADPRHVTPVDAKTLQQLKFSECLPRNLAMKELEARMTDRNRAMQVANERVHILRQTVSVSASPLPVKQ